VLQMSEFMMQHRLCASQMHLSPLLSSTMCTHAPTLCVLMCLAAAPAAFLGARTNGLTNFGECC